MDPLGQVYQGQADTGAAVVINPSFDPVVAYQNKIAGEIEAAKKQALKEQKERQDALNNIANFKADGWYRHDVELKGMVDDLRDYMVTSLSNGVNPENATNKESFMEFQKRKSDIQTAANYSKQIKDNYETQLGRMEGKQDAFTVESIKQFDDYYNSTFEKQLQSLPPVLQEKVEVQSWFKKFRQENKPTTVGSVINNGIVEVRSTGANRAANRKQVENWLSTLLPEDKKNVLAYYGGDEDMAVQKLTEDVNARANVSYGRSEQEAEVYGTSDATADNPLGLTNEVHGDFAMAGGNFDVSWTGLGGKADYTGYNQFSVRSQKPFQIYSREKLYTDKASYTDKNSENTLFQPESVASFATANQNGTIRYKGRTIIYQAGERIPDNIVKEINSGTAQATFDVGYREWVKGRETIPTPSRTTVRQSSKSGDLDFESGGSSESVTESYSNKYRTVYVPLENIVGDMSKNVRGFNDFYKEYRDHNQYNRTKANAQPQSQPQVDEYGIPINP